MSRGVNLFRIGGLMEIVGLAGNGIAGSPYAAQFSGDGGDGSYTFSLDGIDPVTAGWTLVSGLLANSAPSAGDYTVTISMADGSRSSPVVQNYRFTIA